MNSETFESTYALLLRSDEKERSITETAIYLLLILSMLFSMWQVVLMRVTVPESLSVRTVAEATVAQTRGV